MKKRGSMVVLVVVFLLSASSVSFATTKMAKEYKNVFGLDKAPKCVVCHVHEKPKKDDNNTELNEYGKKLKAVKEEVDEESFKTVGPAPEA